MPATPEFSWITLFAGLGLGSIIAALVARWSAKAVTISNHRQNWINALREDIVVFLQEIEKIRHSLSMAIAGQDIARKLSDMENLNEAKNSAMLVYRRILLRLNMTENPHIKLGNLLKDLLKIEEATPDTQQQIDAVVTLSREILKHEWAVAKYGIFTTPVTHLKSLSRWGLFRIWIVTSVVWLAGWIWYVWATCLSNSDGKWCRINLFDDWIKQAKYFTFWDYVSIGASGISVPIAILILGLGALWAVDGFRSRQNSN